MADKFAVERNNSAMLFGTICVEYTPADVDLPSGVRAVFLNATGTINIKNPEGAAVTGIPAAGGVPLPFVPARITAIGTATKVYLVY